MTYLVDFGESGKNFIEIGKRPRVQESMLRACAALRSSDDLREIEGAASKITVQGYATPKRLSG